MKEGRSDKSLSDAPDSSNNMRNWELIVEFGNVEFTSGSDNSRLGRMVGESLIGMDSWEKEVRKNAASEEFANEG